MKIILSLDDLIVQRTTEADAGIYECRASNVAGTHADSTVAQVSSTV